LGLDFESKTKDSVIKSIIILMTGYMAEWCYFGDDSNGANSDKDEAHRLIRLIEKDPEEIKILLKEIDKFTYRLLSDPAVRVALKKVAKELLKKEILTYDEVVDIIEEIMSSMEEEK
jgi:ATP-dependent Zn protease